MTTLHLIRHGANDALANDRLAGRDTTLGLNDEGRAQAERRAESLRDVTLAAIYCSPLLRCRETAAPLARLHGLGIEIRDELIELDFRAWTGLTHAELDEDPRWPLYKAFRGGNAAPPSETSGGETLADVRARMLRLALELRERHPNAEIALVSHGDPIAALIMQLLGLPDDAIERLHIPPCVWATLAFGPAQARLLRLVPL